MQEKKASLTSLMAAFARAYHAENSGEPVFADSAAKELMTAEEYGQIKKYIVGGIDFFAPGRSFSGETELLDYVVNTQLAPTPLARAKCCEEALRTAVKTGATQYVILGAGLDTFAWREPELMAKLTLFEVDHPDTQKDKIERLERAGFPLSERIHFVPADFRKDDLRSRLRGQGFDEKQKTFFSWLGVSYYLSTEDVERMMESIASFAAEGSTLFFDYPDEGLFSAGEKRVQNMLAMAQAGSEPMKFSIGEMDLTLLLEKHHFLLYELLTPEEINRRYYAGRSDGLEAFEHVNYALTVLKNTQFINTKEKILQKALQLFARNGYEAVSVRDIAESLSITKGALYKHYVNKQDIFDCILEQMRREDAQRAKEYRLPEGTPEQMAEAYGKASVESLAAYTKAQFRYWTADLFAAPFRRMMTLEQYRTPKMAALYQQCFVAGPLQYTEELFRAMYGDSGDAALLAMEFYGPVCFLYSLYDGAADGHGVTAMLDQHVDDFCERLKRKAAGA